MWASIARSISARERWRLSSRISRAIRTIRSTCRIGLPREPDGRSRRSDGGGGTITCAALASFDAGETWQRHDFPGRSCLDSRVAMLRDGHVVFLAQEGSELVTFRSTNGGRTWADTSTSFGRGFDHGSMVVDRRDKRCMSSPVTRCGRRTARRDPRRLSHLRTMAAQRSTRGPM